MKKYLSTLLILAALCGTASSGTALATPFAMQMQQLSDRQLNSLFTKVAPIWGFSVSMVWEDYYDGLVTVTPQGGNYYLLTHVDGGSIIAELEDGSF